MGLIAKKALLLLVVDQLAEAIFGFQLRPQDMADSVTGHVSAALVMCLFATLMARMYFFNSIDCFVPAEWPDPWEQATEAYCYMEGAYAVPAANLNKTGPEAWTVKVPQTYYYWLPIILIVLAAILKIPDVLWSLYYENTASQPNQTLQAAAELADPMRSPCKKHEEASSDSESESGSSESDSRSSNSHDSESDGEVTELRKQLGAHLMSSACHDGAIGEANLNGSKLFLVYLMSKGVRFIVCLGSLFFLQHSFGLNSPLFGIQGLTRQSDQKSGEVNTPGFPQLVFCDVALRQMGQWNTRIVQCVLPINLLMDKIALFLWFWLAACSAWLAISAAVWVVRVGFNTRRRSYVQTFARVILGLQLEGRRRRQLRRKNRWPLSNSRNGHATSEASGMQRKAEAEKNKSEKLITALSATDRVFMLRLIQDRLGMSGAYAAMESMTSHYEHRNKFVFV